MMQSPDSQDIFFLKKILKEAKQQTAQLHRLTIVVIAFMILSIFLTLVLYLILLQA